MHFLFLILNLTVSICYLSNKKHPILRLKFQSHSQKTRRRNWTRKKTTNTERRCAVPVGITMHRMSSGYAATYVRSGFTESASRLLRLRLSKSSNTSVHHAATRDLALEMEYQPPDSTPKNPGRRPGSTRLLSCSSVTFIVL